MHRSDLIKRRKRKKKDDGVRMRPSGFAEREEEKR